MNLRYKNYRYQFDQVIKVNIISEGTDHDAIPFVMHRKEHCLLTRMHKQGLIMRKVDPD